jgi:hypothetical protein
MADLMGRGGGLLASSTVIDLLAVGRLEIVRRVRGHIRAARGEMKAGEQRRIREEREQGQQRRRAPPAADTAQKHPMPASWPHDLLRAEPLARRRH